MHYHRLKFKVSHWLEHRIKHIGTMLSGTFTILLGCLLLCMDYFINLPPSFHEQSVYDRLVTVAIVLISIILGISLTTFSVIFVVMQLASSQFSPRILRHFLSNDVKIQQYIGMFIGTIALCIVPQAASALFDGMPFLITLALGVFLAIRCLVWSYPRMITYLSGNMNVAAIVDRVKDEVVNEIDELYRDKWQHGMPMFYIAQKSDSAKPGITIRSPFKTGYLESIDYLKLEKLITDFTEFHTWAEGLIVFQRPVVGEFILQEATALLQVEMPQEPTQEQSAAIETAFTAIAAKVFRVHTFRSYTQDINFGVRKLVDIAIKAISPAVNDPTTCLNCIDQLGAIAQQLQLKQYPSTEACKLRSNNIIVNEFNFDQLVDFCFDQIFQWGKEDPTVVRRLLQTLALLAENAVNPFNLMVLVKEVQDMDLTAIYNKQNVADRGIKVSAEKLEGVLREMLSFSAVVKKRIAWLGQKGFLEQNSNSLHRGIEAGEKEAIAFLKNYARGLEGN